MFARTLRSMQSLLSLRKAIHSTSSAPNPSHLLVAHHDKARFHLNSLTVQRLKQECRSRGLKSTGKKVELIDRIVGFEQAQSFSTIAVKPLQTTITTNSLKTSSQPSTKSFTTSAMLASPESIDSYQIPPPQHKQWKGHPVKKIPIGPTREGLSVQLQSEGVLKGDTGASAGDVHVVDGSSRVSTMNVDLGDGDPKYEEERLGHIPSNQLPPKDRTFLWGLGGLVTLWWGSQWLGSSKNKSK